MPTASTSQILKNTACIEPPKSNFFLQKTGSGEFIIVNRHLYKDLKELGLWKPEIVDKILEEDGSVQGIPDIPTHLQELYKTVWEIDQRSLIDHQAERGPFIDQSTSLNLYLERVAPAALIDLHVRGWMKGLKTGSYYIHSKAQTRSRRTKTKPKGRKALPPTSITQGPVCTMEEGCISCGS
jgi:ribonucleoside-diphosphate reductase alpha chain